MGQFSSPRSQRRVSGVSSSHLHSIPQHAKTSIIAPTPCGTRVAPCSRAGGAPHACTPCPCGRGGNAHPRCRLGAVCADRDHVRGHSCGRSEEREASKETKIIMACRSLDLARPYVRLPRPAPARRQQRVRFGRAAAYFGPFVLPRPADHALDHADHCFHLRASSRAQLPCACAFPLSNAHRHRPRVNLRPLTEAFVSSPALSLRFGCSFRSRRHARSEHWQTNSFASDSNVVTGAGNLAAPRVYPNKYRSARVGVVTLIPGRFSELETRAV